MSTPYKFKTQFDFEVFATDDLENELSISVASLDNLKPLIPKGIDLLSGSFLFTPLPPLTDFLLRALATNPPQYSKPIKIYQKGK